MGAGLAGRTRNGRSEARRMLLGTGAVLVLITVALLAAGNTNCDGPNAALTEANTIKPLQSAWAVGETGTIIRYQAGGGTWTSCTSGTTAFLNAVDFVDGFKGWVVGADGTILYTSDMGQTWFKQVSGVTTTLRSVDFITATTGWVVGDDGVVLATTDGGVHWSAQTTPTSGYSFMGVSFAGADDGCAVGVGSFPNLVVKTSDGGDTWTTAESGTAGLNAVSFVNASLVRAAGDSGTLVGSPDKGVTWTPLTSGTTAKLESIDFATDGQTGLAVGTIYGATVQPVVLRTTNAGATWAPVTGFPVTDQALHSVSCADNGFCTVSGDYGTLCVSTDGGRTFTKKNPPTAKGLWGVCSTLSGAAPSSTRQVEPGGRSAASGGDYVITWDYGFTTTVFGVQNPEVAGDAVKLEKADAPLPARYGAKECFAFTVDAALVYRGGELTVPRTALPELDIPEKNISRLVAFNVAAGGAVAELPGTYDATAKSATFVANGRFTKLILGTDTIKPIAKALRAMTVKRNGKVRLPFSVGDGRPTATVTIAIAKGKKVKARIAAGVQPTNKRLSVTYTARLAPGTYTWTVTAIDRAGNKSAVTAASKKTLVVKR
jgi:photosystem II stability/assembly factor-like uncharacterized protein